MKFFILLACLISIQFISCKTLKESDDEISNLLYQLSFFEKSQLKTAESKTICACPIDPNNCENKVAIKAKDSNLVNQPQIPKDLDKSLLKFLSTIEKVNQESCDKPLELVCKTGKKIQILNATMSNSNNLTCSSDIPIHNQFLACNETIVTHQKVSSMCEDTKSCKISIKDDLANICPCAQNKYLTVEFECVDESTPKREKRQIFGDYYGDYYDYYPFYDYYGYDYFPYDYYGYGYYDYPYDYYGYGYGYGYGYDYYPYDYYGYGYGYDYYPFYDYLYY